jgi:hypothetical protein
MSLQADVETPGWQPWQAFAGLRALLVWVVPPITRLPVSEPDAVVEDVFSPSPADVLAVPLPALDLVPPVPLPALDLVPPVPPSALKVVPPWLPPPAHGPVASGWLWILKSESQLARGNTTPTTSVTQIDEIRITNSRELEYPRTRPQPARSPRLPTAAP